MSDSDHETPRLGVIVYDGDIEVEPVLAAVRDRLRAEGRLKLGGVVPRWGELLSNGKHEMLLDDLVQEATYVISQDLGPGAEACVLDADGLTRMRLAIQYAVETGVDLLIAGKYGKQEAAGHGIREEIGLAVIADLPVLLALRETQIESWNAFAGGPWDRLPPDTDAVVAWANRVTA